MNLSSDGSSLALWGNTTGFENDDRHLFDMAAAYLGDCEEPSVVGHSVFDELEVQGVSANPLTAGE